MKIQKEVPADALKYLKLMKKCKTTNLADRKIMINAKRKTRLRKKKVLSQTKKKRRAKSNQDAQELKPTKEEGKNSQL